MHDLPFLDALGGESPYPHRLVGVTARMRWINGAALDTHKHLEVVDRPALHYSAKGADARDEWPLARVILIALVGIPFGFMLKNRRSICMKRDEHSPDQAT